MVDLLLDREEAKAVVKELGIETFISLLEKDYNYGFYSCSYHWMDDSKYICKLRGSRGDLIIGWYGVHDR